MERGETEPRLLALWSAPRCRSTPFLRMMAERGDRFVVHEPFSHVADFGAAEVDGRVVRSERDLIDALRGLAAERPLFFKDTTDFHYPELVADTRFLREAVHAFMIRDPKAAIASHYRLNPKLGRDEIGFARLHEIYAAVRDATGADPAVIDGDDLVAAPEAIVRAYCARVGIPFVPGALQWQPTVLPSWKRTARWHTSVSESRGFEPPRADGAVDVESHPRLRAYLRYHRPFYDELYARRLRVEG
jgi:sulfotransferase family protein